MDDSKPKVLFAADEFDLLIETKDALTSEFDVTLASAGRIALAMSEIQGPFAVVAADYRLHDMDGIEFLDQIREIAPNAVRILFVDAANIDAAMGATRDGIASRFLCKPCTPKHLLAAIRAADHDGRVVDTMRGHDESIS